MAQNTRRYPDEMSAMIKTAFVLDPSDTVATVLADVDAGDSVFLKGSNGAIVASTPVAFGHKIALAHIRENADIIKYGQKIGFATRDIQPGSWIHLHNMASALDADFGKRIGR